MAATFTRKHYVEIARILHGVRDTAERQRLTEEFERMFKKDNPSFDAGRFSSAVGEAGGGRVREASASGIRSYGPGKFSTILDSIAFEEGVDEEESYEEGGGWYGLLRLDDAARDNICENAKEPLTEEEEAQLDESVAVIFFERSDGIVEAEWFEDDDEAEDRWAEIQEEFEEEEEAE
jgi:hypothetical protein